MTKTSSSCLIFVAIAILALTALAQPADEAKRQNAKERFARGLELVQNERWDAALAEFLSSLEIYRTKVALKNAAVCYRQLKRPVEALEAYEDFVRSYCTTEKPADCELAADAIRQLGREVGEIVVTGAPAGATVVIDGRERGTTPLSRAIRAPSGAHTVRLFKEGFTPFEDQVVLAGAQKKTVSARLAALSESGRLSVREAKGKKLEVVLDGAVVGTTPWSGRVAVGTHTVLLRGKAKEGSPPSQAKVGANQTASLTLSAAVLDAELRVEPTPSHARVDVDGVPVGNGVWEGRLPSGGHVVEVTAEGFLAERREISLAATTTTLRVPLERDLTSPIWKDQKNHLYFELGAGPMLGLGFAGDTDRACDDGACSDRSRPIGFIAVGRGGYAFVGGLGIELGLGYLYLTSSATRTLVADLDLRAVTADDYEDRTTLQGPFAALGASYRFFEKTPLTLRLSAGIARLRASFENSGHYTGTLASGAPYAADVSVPQASPRLWVPFVAPEVRFGYRLSRRFSIDAGVALFLMLPPDTTRNTDGKPVSVGGGNLEFLRLPEERAFGTFFALAPSLAARLDL